MRAIVLSIVVSVILQAFGYTTASSQCCVINIRFSHKLDGKPLTENLVAERDGYFYRISMMRYYISNIRVIYEDGSTASHFEPVFFINAIDTSQNHRIEFTVTSSKRVDSIAFNVGVPFAFNHADPSTYAEYDALGHKVPTMHWGWTAGYRFVTMEGYAGPSAEMLNTNYQVHSVGDELFTPVRIAAKRDGSASDYSFVIDAEYSNALRGISAAFGPITHGSEFEAVTLMQNFGTVVFGNSVTSVDEPKADASQANPDVLRAIPNPTHTEVLLRSARRAGTESGGDVVLHDVFGRVHARGAMLHGMCVLDVSSLPAGSYTATVVENNLIESVRVVVAP